MKGQFPQIVSRAWFLFAFQAIFQFAILILLDSDIAASRSLQ